MADHLRLDFNLAESLAVVHTDNGTDHLRNNDHVTEVGLDGSGLLVVTALSLGLAQLLDQTHRLSLQTTLETTASSGVNQLNQLLVGQVHELFQVNTTVGELTESSLLLNVRVVSLMNRNNVKVESSTSGPRHIFKYQQINSTHAIQRIKITYQQ